MPGRIAAFSLASEGGTDTERDEPGRTRLGLQTPVEKEPAKDDERRQKIRPPDQVGHRFSRNWMGGEKRRAPKRRHEGHADVEREPIDEQGVEEMQCEVHKVVAERPVAVPECGVVGRT